MAKQRTKKTNPVEEEMIARSEVEQLVGELTADLQRVQAEFINYKRRSEEEKIQAIKLGKQQAATVLLPVLDSIERAIAHEPDDIKEHAWVKGIASVATQLESQLAGIGLVKIGQPGDSFDPNLHEAVSMDDSDGETEIIAEILQTGYMFDGQVVRPAMVRVTKK